MFGLFDSKTKKLKKKYEQLLEEAYRLSHCDRKASDLKTAQAEDVLLQLKALEQQSSDS